MHGSEMWIDEARCCRAALFSQIIKAMGLSSNLQLSAGSLCLLELGDGEESHFVENLLTWAITRAAFQHFIQETVLEITSVVSSQPIIIH